MAYYSLDTETHDPLLSTHGPSWVFGQGEVLVTGLYEAETGRLSALGGAGGSTVYSLLTSVDNVVIGANIQYDVLWLCHAHRLPMRKVQCALIDVQVAESFIDEYQPFTLDALAQKYLGEQKKSGGLPAAAAAMGLKGDFRRHMKALWEHSAETKLEVRNYVLSDADQPYRIWVKQYELLRSQGLLEAFALNMKMLRVCCKMKQDGVRVDYDKWRKNCAFIEPVHRELKQNFTKKYGDVNVNSPKQLGAFFDRRDVPYQCRITVRGYEPPMKQVEKKVKGVVQTSTKSMFNVKQHSFSNAQLQEAKQALYAHFANVRFEKNKLRIYVDKRYAERTVGQLTARGYNVTCSPNVDKFFIKEHKKNHQEVADIEELKNTTSIISKFMGPKFERFIARGEDGVYRLHGNFNVVGARQTGRLSSSKINMQNLPAKTVLYAGTDKEVDLAAMCREVFLPEPGHIWCRLDFSGQENRLQAHFAVPPHGKVIRAKYNENPLFDEHQFVADASGLEAEFGEKNGRKYAKNTRFGISYGMQLHRMCLQFGWDPVFAQDLYDRVCGASPWFVDTMQAVQQEVLRTGYITTLGGRRIRLKKGDKKVYPFYNYKIQGSASDQTKAAQVEADETALMEERMLLSVHDEGDYSLPMNEAGFRRMVDLKRIYENAVHLSVPVISEPELGADFAHLEGQRKDETLREFWDRMCAAVRAGSVKERDFTDVEVEDDDEEEEDEEC